MAITDRLGDVGATAELHAEKHVDGVMQHRREICDGAVKRDHTGAQRRHRSEHSTEHSGIHDAVGHAGRLVDGHDHVTRQAALATAVTDQPFGYDCALLWQIVAQVGMNGVTPVDVAEARPSSALAARERTVHSLLGPRRQSLFDLLDDLGNDLPRRSPGCVRQELVELDQQRDEVQVRFDGAEHLWLEKQLAKIEPIDGVALQDLDHRRREVSTDVTQPASYRRRRRPQPARATPAATPGRRAVVHRGQCCVDPCIVAVELQAGDTGTGAGVARDLIGTAQDHPPSSQSLRIADSQRGDFTHCATPSNCRTVTSAAAARSLSTSLPNPDQAGAA